MTNFLDKYISIIFGASIFLVFACIGATQLGVIFLIGRMPLLNLIVLIAILIIGLIMGFLGYRELKNY